MKISGLISAAAIATGMATLAVVASPLTASAATFNFSNIANSDNTGGDSIVGQLKLDVTDASAGKTLWKFSNTATATSNSASFISQIYFDWANSSLALTSPSFNIGNIGSVKYKSGANPNNLPQGNNIGFVADLAITNDKQGSGKDGIDLSESLGVIFNSPTASVIAAAINGGTFRVGYRVQGIAVNNGNSDAYVSCTSSTCGTTPPPAKPVPVPGFLLGLMAAGALGGTRLLKNKKQAS